MIFGNFFSVPVISPSEVAGLVKGLLSGSRESTPVASALALEGKVNFATTLGLASGAATDVFALLVLEEGEEFGDGFALELRAEPFVRSRNVLELVDTGTPAFGAAAEA